MLKSILLFGIWFMLVSSNGYSQEKNNILKIKIKGMKYDQLCLRIGLDNGKLLALDGQSKNKKDWTFSILVYPGGHMENIDVRDKDAFEKLYKTLQ